MLIKSDGPGETHDPFFEVARDLSMSSIFTIEYEHTWPTECWPDNLPRAPGAHKEIWGADAGKPTGQRFLLDVPNVRDQAHAWEIVRADALHGFGSILHSVTLQPSGYVSQGFRRKDQEEHL
jgi:hypothetical protein